MLDFARVLRWDQSKHPRDEDGRFTETVGTVRGEVRTTSEQARRDMLALGKKIEQHERRSARAVEKAREAYQAWFEATKTGRRGKPLKPDGAAAKKLPEWKAAQEADAEVQRVNDEARRVRKEVTAEALTQLEVPPSERSRVQFLVPKGQLHSDPGAEAGIAYSAARALDQFRKYDGSGSFIGTALSEEGVKRIRESLPDIPLETGPDGVTRIASKLRLTMAPSGERPSASAFGVQIRGTRDLERVVNHEVAHHVEFNNRAIYDAAVELRKSLATNYPVTKPLNELRQTEAYGIDEIAMPGRFLEPYTGKVYPDEAKATEIISMGVEHYLSDPIRFAREAPEHFKLIWDVMHGKYRKQGT